MKNAVTSRLKLCVTIVPPLALIIGGIVWLSNINSTAATNSRTSLANEASITSNVDSIIANKLEITELRSDQQAIVEKDVIYREAVIRELDSIQVSLSGIKIDIRKLAETHQ